MLESNLLHIAKEHVNAAKLPREVRELVLRLLDDNFKSIYGTVTQIHTLADEVRKTVAHTDANGSVDQQVTFTFPPNAERFDAELRRAQSGKLKVGISYHLDADKRPIIDGVTVFEAPLPEPV